MDRTIPLTWGHIDDLFRRWSDEYLRAEHAWRIDGRPVCAFSNLFDFVARYGHTPVAVMLRYGSKIVRDAVGVEPFMLGVIGQADERNAELANNLPFDAVTGYGLLPNWLGEPVQEYGSLIEQRVAEWDELQHRLRIPFYPVVCAGWDASVRGSFRGVLRAEDGYPYSPVVTGVTPELFGRFLDHALAFNHRWQPRANVVFLHAWNEWSESSVLEPSDRFGTGFLDEIRKRRGIGVFADMPPTVEGAPANWKVAATEPETAKQAPIESVQSGGARVPGFGRG